MSSIKNERGGSNDKPTCFRRTQGGRARKLRDAKAADLTRIGGLATRQLGGVAGRIAIDGVSTVPVGPSGGVEGMPCRSGGARPAAVGADNEARDECARGAEGAQHCKKESVPFSALNKPRGEHDPIPRDHADHRIPRSNTYYPPPPPPCRARCARLRASPEAEAEAGPGGRRPRHMTMNKLNVLH